MSSEIHVVFFDGFCVLCNSAVSYLIKLDKRRVLRYSSLQGKHAQEMLDLNRIQLGSSILFLSQGVVYQKAEAVIQISFKLGGFYSLCGKMMSLAPLKVLNSCYDLVAKYRYKIFGKTETCFLPRQEDRHLFLQ